MVTERNTSSVLAKLMGIEKPLPANNSHGRQRVLSDSYHQNIASITRRQRLSSLSFFKDENESSMAVDEETCNSSSCYDLGCMSSPYSSPASVIKRQKSNDTRVLQERSQRGIGIRSFTRNNPMKDCSEVANTEREVGTSQRKSDRRPCTDAARYLSKPSEFPSAWVPRRKRRDLNLDSRWCLRIEKQESLQARDEFGGEFVRSTLEPDVGDGLISGECEITKALRILNHSKKLEEANMSEEDFSAPESSSESSVLAYIESPTYREALMTTLGDTDDMNLGNHVSHDDGFCWSPLNDGEIIDEEDRKVGTCIKLQRDNEELSSEEASTCFLLEDKGSSFAEIYFKHQVKDNSSEPVSPVSSLEGPEACRCWPNKPLVESKQISSIPEFLETSMHGFQPNLRPTDAISLESVSEGPEMAVSSDGDDEGSSVGCYREDAQITYNLHGTSENRDFSYVVDVLSELGFPDLNLETESEAWRCQGFVLSPLVFDSLEKKYGKQAFWERSERKLLYDRTNQGLMQMAESLDPVNSLRRWPLAKRVVGPNYNEEPVEEELWALLVKQEEEAKRGMCSKVSAGEMEWLEVDEHTYAVVKEVERLLLDELMEEFVCTTGACR